VSLSLDNLDIDRLPPMSVLSRDIAGPSFSPVCIAHLLFIGLGAGLLLRRQRTLRVTIPVLRFGGLCRVCTVPRMSLSGVAARVVRKDGGRYKYQR